jgi:hypothetical protein
MNKTSLVLIQLLSKAIRNQKPDPILEESIDWNSIYEEAVDHQVHTLIHPLLSQLPLAHRPNQHLMSIWQKETILASSTQLQHMQQIKNVLDKFHLESIPVVALKGLILREYYPHAELRIMGDADVLVHKQDLKRAKKLLKSIGYMIAETTDRHIKLYYNNHPAIELHWLLNDKEASEEAAYFTDTIWENVVTTSIYGAPALILSTEDQIIHLLLHFVQHILITGFGLRQLCDFVLLIEANSNKINWEHIIDRVNSYRLLKFTTAIFIISNKLFNLEIPMCFFTLYSDENNNLELLIHDIISAGVYGRRTQNRDSSYRVMKYINANDTSRKFADFNNILQFLFPPAKSLGQKYNYAKNFPLLLPLAWLHRGIYNNKRLGEFQLNKASDIEATSKARATLLRWLQLH